MSDCGIWIKIFEPHHSKIHDVAFVPSQDSDKLQGVHCLSSIPCGNLGVKIFNEHTMTTMIRLYDAQANLGHQWAHMPD